MCWSERHRQCNPEPPETVENEGSYPTRLLTESTELLRIAHSVRFQWTINTNNRILAASVKSDVWQHPNSSRCRPQCNSNRVGILERLYMENCTDIDQSKLHIISTLAKLMAAHTELHHQNTFFQSFSHKAKQRCRFGELAVRQYYNEPMNWDFEEEKNYPRQGFQIGCNEEEDDQEDATGNKGRNLSKNNNTCFSHQS